MDNIGLIIGKNLRHRRRLLGLSQEAVGSYLGITYQQMQKYEVGKNEISCAKMLRLAALFKCSLNELCIDGLDEATALSVEPLHSRHAYPLIADFNRIQSHAVREKICRLVQTLADATAAEGL
jgi:transcriptional regulator with XRE-family HTH domain